jgi:hypothetical protein
MIATNIRSDRHFEQAVDLRAPVTAVFDYLDDFERLGAHMMRSSWMMAGSAMRYEFDAGRGRKPNARVRLAGSFLGIKLEIDEEVTQYEPPLRKAWSTVGAPRMIILRGYRLGYELTPVGSGSRLTVFIDYQIPERGPARWLGQLLAAGYARWCVKSMIADAARTFRDSHAPDKLARGAPS